MRLRIKMSTMRYRDEAQKVSIMRYGRKAQNEGEYNEVQGMRLRMKVSIMRCRDEAQDEGEYNEVQG